MEANRTLHAEFVAWLDEAHDFFRLEQQIYGNGMYLEMPVENLALAKDVQKRKLLTELFLEVRNCRRCGLAETRGKIVFGGGNAEAEILLIGEAPGYHEDLQGKPFVGEAGLLLEKILAAIHLKRDEVFITNIIKCRPPNNRDPEPDEQTACLPILEQQLKILQPRFILILGRIAAQALLKTEDSVSKLRGVVHQIYGAQAVVTYHPAALLRNAKLKRDTWADVQLFEKCILGK